MNIDWTAVLDWAETHPQLAVTAVVLALAAVALTIYTARSATRTAGRFAKASGQAAKKLDLVVVGAAIVALAATAGSVQAMWDFLQHDLGISDTFMRATIVIVLDATGIISAIMAREDRINKPGTIGLNSVAVWVVALLLGFFGANEATTTDGQTLRFVIPLVAAWMWDRVIHRDVARKASIDKAKVSTITGRIFSAIAGTIRSIKDAIVRQGARWGLFHPADEDTATIRRNRWRRQLINRAAAAADALRDIEATEHLPATDRKRTKATRAYAKTVPPFRASIVAGQQLGAITSPADLETILWESAVVIRAEDALLAAAGQSPWSTDRVEQIDPPTDQTIDAEVIDQDDRPTTPTDRPVTDRPVVAVDRPRPTDRRPDRPTEPVDPVPTDRPDTDRSTRSIEPAPTARPTDTPAPVEPATDRPEAIEGEVIDRPTGGRRSKEENENRIIDTITVFLGDAETAAFPSQGRISEIAGVSKSTVADYCKRHGLNRDTEINRELIAALPVHNIHQ